MKTNEEKMGKKDSCKVNEEHDSCGCGHEHHRHDDCCCGHEHHHHDDCCCGHEHHHHDDCCCGHEHHHDHDGCCHEGCACHGGLDKERIKKTFIRLGIALVLAIAGFLTRNIVALPVFLYVAAYIISSYDVLWNSLRNIRRGEIFDENFLMSVASLGAMILGEYTEGIAVMLLYQTGEMLQGMAVDKSRKSITKLMDIRPPLAHVEMNGEVVDCIPEDVQPGQIVVVKPGEKVPVDGVVKEGKSQIDTVALTGESVPRGVHPGENVLSGCVNLTGQLRVETTKAYADSTVAHILKLVEESKENKASTERFITRFARIYTPAVVGLAVLLALIPPFFDHMNFVGWIHRALTFLVISCPCALVISVPLSYYSGIGGASRNGILIKGATFLEKLSETEIAVFDKTGTLTQGTFKVTESKAVTGTESEMLRLSAAVEQGSNHPIAKSLLTAWGESKLPEAQNVQEVTGCGLTAAVEGKHIAVGNDELMKREGCTAMEASSNGTVVHVAADQKYLGYIVISDTMKKGAKEALMGLKKIGVEKTVLLSGDREKTVQAVGEELGVDEIFAQQMPQEKVERMEEMLSSKKNGKSLIYVGDGINDAPVLARADVGVAMGALGADAAIEAADVVLMDDDLNKLSFAIRIAKRTMQVCRQNISMVLLIKLVVLVMGALGYAPMWLAVFADVGVCLIAVANALRAMYAK